VTFILQSLATKAVTELNRKAFSSLKHHTIRNSQSRAENSTVMWHREGLPQSPTQSS